MRMIILLAGSGQKRTIVVHPDFLWMPFEPAVATGDRGRGNPMISNENVIEFGLNLWVSQTQILLEISLKI